MLPVDGGSARDLRAAAIAVDPARQLTGLCATTHRPDARAQAPAEDFSLCPEGEEMSGQPCSVFQRGEMAGDRIQWVGELAFF